MMDHMHYRNATESDAPALWEMLTYAASMVGPVEENTGAARADASLAAYVQGFGTRRGDVGVVAIEAGEIVGAAWVRLASTVAAHYSVASAAEPEMAFGVRPGLRGQGVGTEILRRLLAITDSAFPAVVLSVRSGNPSIRLYERAGFVRTGTLTNRVGTTSFTMRRPSPPTEPADRAR